jgi:hypothetical protein
MSGAVPLLPHYTFMAWIRELSLIQDSTVTTWNIVPEENKVCTIFIYLFLWRLTSLLLVYLNIMNAISVCIAETHSFVLFTFV